MPQDKDKIVYFVRHGQSVDNTRPVFPLPDGPLSPKGEHQAEIVANRLSKLPFDALISSPLKRAEQTAAHISVKTGIQSEFSELFVERTKPTAIDGKPWEDPVADKLFRAWKQSLFNPGQRVEDGENFDDLVARAGQALDYLQARLEGRLAVVTHGFFLNTILASVLTGNGLTPAIFETFQNRAMLENTSLTVLRYMYDDFDETYAWRLWAFNDHAHFAN